jgi:tetratricopeptide (TPR) repeat protein
VNSAALLIVFSALLSQIPTEIAAELDRLLAQVAEAPVERDPVERARRLELLGDLEIRAGMLAAARSALDEALAIRTQHAADDRELGRLAFKLAKLANRDQRLADADRFIEMAVARLTAGAPKTLEYADPALEAQLAEFLGDAAVRRRDLEAADAMYSRSLAALEGAQRHGLDYARVTNALAVVAASRNQAPRAQQLYETSLKIYEAERPGSLEMSQVLDNLGILLMNRRELAASEGMFRRSLKIKTDLKVYRDEVGTAHSNLGLVLLEQGRLDDARHEFEATLEIRRNEAPPLELAWLQTNLARIDRLRGRLEAATIAARQALELRRTEAPGTLLVAASATELGLAREAAGDYIEALALHKEALAIRERLAANTAEVAESLDRMAAVTAIAGDPLAARTGFERAVDAWARVSPGSLDHIHAVHEAGRFILSRDATEGLRRMREALDLLERSSSAGTGSIDARAQRIPRLRAYYGAPLRILAERGDAGEAFTLLDRLHERLRRARAEDDTAMTAMAPLDAVKAMDAGTLLVAFSVQPAASYAFVGTRDTPMRVYRIDENAAALAGRVEKDPKALVALLFKQFEQEANRADGLLIVPDGPLDAVPFSSLSRKPVTVAPSLVSIVAPKHRP